MKKIKIIVIDDKREELDRAKAAIEAAGHEAFTFSNFSYRRDVPSVWEQMEGADGVITDLFFNPRHSNDEVNAHYDQSPPPMGLVVALHAVHVGKPVVICTCGNHHGPELSFVFDCYLSGRSSRAFGWEENKDWSEAVKRLEERLAR